jgi:hypothetical protein
MMFGYSVIVAGTVLSFVSAVVPHYTSGYHFMFGVLAAGIIPYLMYALAVVLFKSNLTNGVGLVLLTLHAWLVFSERFIDGGKYADHMIYIVPLLFAVLLIPLFVRALREPWRE